MNAKEVPAHPNLEQYKKQAKDLVKARKSGDPETLRRIRQVHSRLGKLSDAEFQSSKFALADAQFIIAREHSFESWPRFAKHLASLNRESSRASLWESAQNAVIKGDVSTLERLLRENAEWFSQRQPPAYVPSGPRPHYADADAQTIIAREHDFESFDAFAKYLEARNSRNSLTSQFESAVDAVVGGDLATLDRLLRANAELIRARSTRRHHATLLHYIGANGVEGFRQKTPPNAVKVAEMLLKGGAEVDAVAEMYGGSTTLGLVATSIHPWLAGVQDALMEILLDHGHRPTFPPDMRQTPTNAVTSGRRSICSPGEVSGRSIGDARFLQVIRLSVIGLAERLGGNGSGALILSADGDGEIRIFSYSLESGY